MSTFTTQIHTIMLFQALNDLQIYGFDVRCSAYLWLAIVLISPTFISYYYRLGVYLIAFGDDVSYEIGKYCMRLYLLLLTKIHSRGLGFNDLSNLRT